VLVYHGDALPAICGGRRCSRSVVGREAVRSIFDGADDFVWSGYREAQRSARSSGVRSGPTRSSRLRARTRHMGRSSWSRKRRRVEVNHALRRISGSSMVPICPPAHVVVFAAQSVLRRFLARELLAFARTTRDHNFALQAVALGTNGSRNGCPGTQGRTSPRSVHEPEDPPSSSRHIPRAVRPPSHRSFPFVTCSAAVA
jgi:hypothetical protein